MLSLIKKTQRGKKAIAGVKTSFLKDNNFTGLLNLFLLLVSLIAFAQIVYSYRQPDPPSFRFSEDKASTVDSESLKLPKISLKPLSYYEERINRRDIFSGHFQAAQTAEASAATSSTSATPEFFRNLKLRGIIMAEEPQAIIQDAQDKESFFVGLGDGLKEAVVRDITEEKVILEYRGQRVELIRK